MTTIVAVETPQGIIIGSDAQSTLGYQKSINGGSKVFTSGEYTVGVAGRARLGQALQHAILPDVKIDDIDKHVSTVLAPAIKKISTHAGIKDDEALHSIVLVAVRGRVYLIMGDGTYLRNDDGVYAIGSGSDYALGALASTYERDVESVQRALNVAAAYDIGTSGPFTITTI